MIFVGGEIESVIDGNPSRWVSFGVRFGAERTGWKGSTVDAAQVSGSDAMLMKGVSFEQSKV